MAHGLIAIRLASSCLANTFLIGIYIRLIYHFDPKDSLHTGDLAEVTNTTSVVTRNTI